MPARSRKLAPRSALLRALRAAELDVIVLAAERQALSVPAFSGDAEARQRLSRLNYLSAIKAAERQNVLVALQATA